MAVIACRVCRAGPLEPWLVLPDMPQSAQALPLEHELSGDEPKDLVISHCRQCGLVQSASPPVPYYREVIRAAAYSKEMMEFRLRQFDAFVRDYGLQGCKVLEVGSGRGEYLQLLKQVGLQAQGLEYGLASFQSCLKDGLDVQRLFPEALSNTIENAPFDAFVSFNFLEHWPDPRLSLEVIAQHLVPEGVGLVEVPNFDMILEKGLLTEFIADHIFYFTSSTLRNLLELSGLDVISIEPVWHNYILSALVRRKKPLASQSFEVALKSLAQELHDFADQYSRVAVWGAGHQALATLALTHLGPKICYVVDSAPFKQGRFTPATHVPIVPPSRLRQDPVDAVIVMAAAYSDEVLRGLRLDFGTSLKFAVLRENRLQVIA